MADHCLGAALYALKAVEATGKSADVERAWQLAQVPDELRDLVVSALERRVTVTTPLGRPLRANQKRT
jgi:hypothetical protein